MGQKTVLCPWDYEIDSEDDEDWMFSSIKLYHHLYMFNINISPVSISMSPDNKCVALADKESGHLEVYRLPGKLVADTRAEEGLTSNRDFSLISGTVNCDNVTCVSYLDSNSLVTTQDNSQVEIISCHLLDIYGNLHYIYIFYRSHIHLHHLWTSTVNTC